MEFKNDAKFITFYTLIFLTINCRYISCGNFGYISPIEVVEEWGCHDTEIRLTCGHLDSTIAILEATFTPNCTETVDGNDENNCAHIDLKRLTRAYTSPLIDHQMAETEAGKKFLDTMRRSKEIEAALNESLVTNKIADLKHQSSYIELKSKRNSLRSSLEELILEYLRGLSPPGDEENYMEFSKRIRKKREIYVNERDNGKHENNSDKLDLDADSVYQRTEIGAMNITVESAEDYDSDTKYDRYKSVSERSVCLDHRRRITQLDQFALDQSIQNEDDEEHNIRRVLNYRCSGKNHCSFVFSLDHPFSMLWDSGIVRVKYICMEDFRVNKFCGEHLLIGTEKQSVDEFTRTNEGKGEPVAEARIQADQSFHHLKILKSGETNDSHGPVDSTVTNEKDKKRRKNHRVYSQDFRILKILPSNVDDMNDITKIGNEIYFKKDENEIEDNNSLTTLHEPSTEVTHRAGLDEHNEAENNILENENENNWNQHQIVSSTIDTMHSSSNKPSPTTTTISASTTTSGTSTKTYENPSTQQIPNSRENVLNENETIREDVVEDIHSVQQEISNEIIEKNESSQTKPPFIFTEKLNKGNLVIEHDQRLITPKPSTTPPPMYHNKIYKENSVIKSNDIIDNYDDEADYSYEDFAIEYNGRKVMRQNKIRNHTSYQTSVFKRPLLQGFLATTGYPKFYIGDSNCSWRISAPIGQRVRITVLDINLRYDFICKDFIQIFDLEIGRMLFNSCSEHARPIQVLSDSNHIMITVNTTSKVAYPKRGVLVHYTALGCLTPSAPLHGRLVHKSENSAKYICDPTFVFPDTAVSSRELICTSSHTWDKVLPNCIEQSSVHNSGIITVSQYNHKKDTVTMAEKDDMMYNIVIPSSVIAVLFIVNALVFLAIMRCRQRKRGLEFDPHELAQL